MNRNVRGSCSAQPRRLQSTPAAEAMSLYSASLLLILHFCVFVALAEVQSQLIWSQIRLPQACSDYLVTGYHRAGRHPDYNYSLFLSNPNQCNETSGSPWKTCPNSSVMNVFYMDEPAAIIPVPLDFNTTDTSCAVTIGQFWYISLLDSVIKYDLAGLKVAATIPLNLSTQFTGTCAAVGSHAIFSIKAAPKSSFVVLDTTKDTFTGLASPRTRFGTVSCAGVGPYLFVAGGGASEVDVYDFMAQVWNSTFSLTNKSDEGSPVSIQTLGSKVFFAGGSVTIQNASFDSNVIDIYDTATHVHSTYPISQPRIYMSSARYCSFFLLFVLFYLFILFTFSHGFFFFFLLSFLHFIL